MSSTAEWLLEIGGLTVGARDGVDTDIVAQGRALAAQLQAAAGAHLRASGCDRTGCGPDCLLAAVDGGPAACRLAVSLVADPSAACRRDRTRAVAQYTQAVRAAATAVFHCRRHAHPAGECWFSDDSTDLCGDVLAVAHRLCS